MTCSGWLEEASQDWFLSGPCCWLHDWLRMPLILTSPFYSERWEKGVEQELAEKQRKEERKGRGGKRGKEGRKGGKNSSPGRLSLNLKVKSISGIGLFCSPSPAQSQPSWREWPDLFLPVFSSPVFFFFFGPEAYGILVSWPGTETMPSPLEGKVLTTGLPEKSLFSLFKTGS